MKDRYPIVCLSGSMKFFDIMQEKAIAFSQQGFVVLMPFKDNRDTITDAEREHYARLQKSRIDMCDSLYVVDPNGYIGSATKEEIKYAIDLNKSIEYMVVPELPKTYTLIGSRKFIKEFRSVAAELTLRGHIVHIPAIFYVDANEVHNLTREQHHMFDTMHKMKMAKSDVVMVINPSGYIGKDTKEEIQYALDGGLHVEYLHGDQEDSII